MHEKMYREFVEGLCKYYNEDTKLPLANEDIRYALDLQKKRLEHQNVSMRLHYTLRGEWMDKVCTRKFQDLKYTNDLTWTWLEKDVSYLINYETKLKVKQKEILYTIITDLKSKNIQDKIICPNCGNIINLNELVEHGCSFCKTHFMMSDLFPCITNYYAIKDLGMNDKEVKRKIGLFAIIGAVAVNAINFPFLMITFQEYGIFLTVLYMILLSVAGGIASYLFYPFLYL